MITTHIHRRTATMTAALFAAAISVEAALAGGSVIRVPADQPTIQAAINAATAGDEVVISAGTYVETINLLGKAITVRGDTGDPLDTVINGGASGTSVVTCSTGETSATRLIGVTVTGGAVGLTGGGMFIQLSSPLVSNCRFVGNSAGSGGAGIVVLGGTPTIDDCAFIGNSTPGNGGGVYVTSGDPVITGSTFQGNSAAVGGGVSVVVGSPAIENCTFFANGAGLGGGVASDGGAGTTIVGCGFYSNTGTGGASRGGAISNRSTVLVANCVFSGNTANTGGAITNENASVPQIINCTLWGNSATLTGGSINAESATPVYVNCIIGNSSPNVSSESLGAITTVVHSDVEGGWFGLGINNLNVDPLLTDPDGADNLPGTVDDDLTLRFGSPCIDMGDGNSLPEDTLDLDDDLDVFEAIPMDMAGADRIEGAAVDLGAYEFHPSGPIGIGGSFGLAAANAGDVDGDGTDDLVVGAPKWNAGRGKVFVYDGETGALLWDRQGQAGGDGFGRAVATAGDLDMDGRPEVIVGAPYHDNANGTNAGRIYVYDGATGALIMSRLGVAAGDRFGWSVAGGGDVNDDGVSDLVVGAPMNDAAGANAGRVYVYSGVDASLLKRQSGELAGDRLGWAVAIIGNVDGDGHADFAVSAPWNDNDDGVNAGRVYVVAGNGYSVIYRRDGEATGDRFGWSLAGIGRANGDAFDDLVVGAPDRDRAGEADAGRVYLLSGATGARIFSRSDQGGSRFGISVAAAGDADCDGAADFVVGGHLRDNSRGADAGRVRIISGATGATLDHFDGLAANDVLGRAVASLGDIDADGMIEVIGGAPGAGASGEGAAYILDTIIECASPPATWDGPPDPSLADRDGDGLVTGSDAMRVLRSLGTGDPRGDVDGDGIVTAADLGFVLDHLGLSESDPD